MILISVPNAKASSRDFLATYFDGNPFSDAFFVAMALFVLMLRRGRLHSGQCDATNMKCQVKRLGVSTKKTNRQMSWFASSNSIAAMVIFSGGSMGIGQMHGAAQCTHQNAPKRPQRRNGRPKILFCTKLQTAALDSSVAEETLSSPASVRFWIGRGGCVSLALATHMRPIFRWASIHLSALCRSEAERKFHSLPNGVERRLIHFRVEK